MRTLAVLTATLVVCAACGASDDEPTAGTGTADQTAIVTTATTTTDTVGPPSLGCDTLPNCFPELATEALANCDERRLSADGRSVRDKLRRLVDEGVDYSDHHATQAAIDTMHAFEDACR